MYTLGQTLHSVWVVMWSEISAKVMVARKIKTNNNNTHAYIYKMVIHSLIWPFLSSFPGLSGSGSLGIMS